MERREIRQLTFYPNYYRWSVDNTYNLHYYMMFHGLTTDGYCPRVFVIDHNENHKSNKSIMSYSSLTQISVNENCKR